MTRSVVGSSGLEDRVTAAGSIIGSLPTSPTLPVRSGRPGQPVDDQPRPQRLGWDVVAPAGGGGKPPKEGRGKLPPASDLEQVLWSDSYQFDNPFGSAAPGTRPCPGTASWGYWPELSSGAPVGFCEKPEMLQMRSFLERIRAPTDDLETDNDWAVRVFEALAEHYDIHAPLSTGHPRRPRRAHPADERAIFELKAELADLQEEVAALEEDLKDCIPRKMLVPCHEAAHKARRIITDIHVEAVKTLSASAICGEASDMIVSAVKEASKQLQALTRAQKQLKTSLESFRVRLTPVGTAAAACLTAARDHLFCLGLQAYLRDPDVPELQDVWDAAVEAVGEHDDAPGDLSTVPQGDKGFADTDVRHSKCVQGLVRLCVALPELAALVAELKLQVRQLEDGLRAERKRRVAAEKEVATLTGELEEERRETERQREQLQQMAAEAEARMRETERLMRSKGVEDEDAIQLLQRVENILREHGGPSAERQRVCDRLFELDRLYGSVRRERMQAVRQSVQLLSQMAESPRNIGSSNKPSASAVSMLERDRERLAKLEAKMTQIRALRATQLEAVLQLQDLGSSGSVKISSGTEVVGESARVMMSVVAAVGKLRRYAQAERRSDGPPPHDAIGNFLTAARRGQRQEPAPAAPALKPGLDVGGTGMALRLTGNAATRNAASLLAQPTQSAKPVLPAPSGPTGTWAQKSSTPSSFEKRPQGVVRSFGQTVLSLRGAQNAARPQPGGSLPFLGSFGTVASGASSGGRGSSTLSEKLALLRR
eukprot:TRINITY_DN4026_c0_g1_i1.p1 TRINITY_DN4026_c0_g1~~TRINITY_DN4026_c0_g1_i1.p1  ORF type:complete len:792 (+),score=259.58 TRINITY_DN4026_c0_g1_i1:68-2377(+)